MGTDETWEKHAARLRDLARDPAVAAYLLGRLCATADADVLADLVQACLVYRERFGAAGNDRSPEAPALVRLRRNRAETAMRHGVEHATGMDELPDL